MGAQNRRWSALASTRPVERQGMVSRWPCVPLRETGMFHPAAQYRVALPGHRWRRHVLASQLGSKASMSHDDSDDGNHEWATPHVRKAIRVETENDALARRRLSCHSSRCRCDGVLGTTHARWTFLPRLIQQERALLATTNPIGPHSSERAPGNRRWRAPITAVRRR